MLEKRFDRPSTVPHARRVPSRACVKLHPGSGFRPNRALSARDLGRELSDLLDTWENDPVAVRVVSTSDDLIAVFAGTLGARNDEKSPSAFWPVGDRGTQAPFEQSGIYAHRELVADVRVHEGGFVVEFDQAGTTVNVRRL